MPACTCLRARAGEKVSPSRETKGKATIADWTAEGGGGLTRGGIGRSSEDSSTLLRVPRSLAYRIGKNNGYFLP